MTIISSADGDELGRGSLTHGQQWDRPVPAGRGEPTPPVESPVGQRLSPSRLGVILDQLVWRARHHKLNIYDSWRGDDIVTPMLRSAQRELLASGSSVKVLTAPEASLEANEMRLEEIRRGGAQIRVRPSGLPEAVILDSNRCLLRMGGTWRGHRHTNLIQDPAVVAALYSSFVVVWDDSVELSLFRRIGVSLDDETTSAVLEMLVKGCKDETAAKNLGMSVRTYRRRIAEIMNRLGARSRFQAGAKAVRLGLVRDWGDEDPG